MNTITIRGAAAKLVWGYHQAAVLGSWEMDGPTVTAKVISHDAFKVSQQPLTFVVQRPTGHLWTWRVQSLQITGTTLSASISQE